MTTPTAPSDPSRGAAGFIGVLPAGTRLMEYEIRRVLGKPGGFGVTYLAHDTNLQSEVALKEFLPVEFALRGPDGSIATRSEEDRAAFDWGLRCFLNEARLLARFRHINVVQVHRLFEASGTAYIVLEYVRGRTLAEHLKEHPALNQAAVEAFLLPLLDGLHAVHEAGVLHRDLKPENILLREDATPVLIDFGAARTALGNRSRSIMSVLTAGYAPIEQYSQNGHQGPWTDIYAMGAVVHRALTGRKPADVVDRLGADPVEPLASRLRDRPFRPEFLRAVDWALRVRIEDRPQTVADWRRALRGELEPPAFVAAAPVPATGEIDLDLGEPAASATEPHDPSATHMLVPPMTIPPPDFLRSGRSGPGGPAASATGGWSAQPGIPLAPGAFDFTLQHPPAGADGSADEASGPASEAGGSGHQASADVADAADSAAAADAADADDSTRLPPASMPTAQHAPTPAAVPTPLDRAPPPRKTPPTLSGWTMRALPDERRRPRRASRPLTRPRASTLAIVALVLGAVLLGLYASRSTEDADAAPDAATGAEAARLAASAEPEVSQAPPVDMPEPAAAVDPAKVATSGPSGAPSRPPSAAPTSRPAPAAPARKPAAAPATATPRETPRPAAPASKPAATERPRETDRRAAKAPPPPASSAKASDAEQSRPPEARPAEATANAVPPAAALPEPVATPVPPEFAGMLVVQNLLREEVGAPPLAWAEANARDAQAWAEQLAREDCKMRFNPEPQRRRVFRENLFQAYANAPYEGWRRTPEQVVERWGDGAALYDEETGMCREVASGCSQYAQMVADNARFVGCGRARCPAAEVWVCTYSPPKF